MQIHAQKFLKPVLLLVVCVSAIASTNHPLPPVISRADWGARPPKSDISTYESYGLQKPVYTDVVLHITNMGKGYGTAEAKRIQDKQMDDLKMSDIAYNFLIDSDGRIFEGRSLRQVPSHAGQSQEGNTDKDIRLDPDYAAIGISFSSGADDALSDEQIKSAKKLILFWHSHSGFNIREVYTHAEVKQRLELRGLTPIGGYNPHECTGHGSVEQILDLRNELKSEINIPFDEQNFRNLHQSVNNSKDGL